MRGRFELMIVSSSRSETACHSRDHIASHALANKSQTTDRMKGLCFLLLALALVFRAAPSCAAPPEVANATMDANCDHMGDNQSPGNDHDRAKTTQACHACVFPVTEERPAVEEWFGKAQAVLAPPQRRQAGTIGKPPIPPPRLGPASTSQFQSWS